MKQPQNKKYIMLSKNNLVIGLIFAIALLFTFWYGKNQTIKTKIESGIQTNNKEPTFTSLPSLTQAVVNNATNNSVQTQENSNNLSLERRQELGRVRAKIEEALRKTKEDENKLRSNINDIRQDCDLYTNTNDQCLENVKELERKLDNIIRQNETDAIPLKEKISEINALLGQ